MIFPFSPKNVEIAYHNAMILGTIFCAPERALCTDTVFVEGVLGELVFRLLQQTPAQPRTTFLSPISQSHFDLDRWVTR